ncbi:SCO6745 family protein [Streptomyces sp. A5-4]|uniref:SCO6745 family protein n=1 Tax=Streptomyces sp. A5-4 TaxID=3384771 RepID=UPI003DA7ECEB
MTSLPAGKNCHAALNPLHSLIYFAPEAEQEYTAAGLEAGRMSYFAGRAAAMGPVGQGVVAATFFNFSPSLVARHIPRAWDLVAPADILVARLKAVDRVLHRLLGDGIHDDPEVREAAELARTATEACTAAGRPLYAAHADLPTPDQPLLALWHAITLLREYRGDGHLAALSTGGLDGVEALITHTATGKGFTAEFAQHSRGWNQQEWDDAQDRLRDRDILDAAGELTPLGAELRRETEQTTDRLARAPYDHLGQAGVERLTEIGGRLAKTAVANGAFPAGVFAQR